MAFLSKPELRRRIWARIRASGVARFPILEGHTPNFVGAERATRLLRELTLWKRARTVKLGLDAPLLSLRRMALLEGKTVYLAVPGLRTENCFVELDPQRLRRSVLPFAASLRGALRFGRTLSPSELQPIDLVVVGSLAANRHGARIGKGGGETDLEYGLLRREGKVREYTPVVTLLHPVQVLDERIPMRAHDVPVDFLVTVDQVLAAPNLHPRPRGIFWELLPEEAFRKIPVLRKGRREMRFGTRPV
ncbi:MAG: 5-formyltetrahydrofolate cyclo-ligase [Candidatus Binatia bacterium]|nr:MAG: 5-formyltetrahydrofolate cyclo-ligase [Candidatus Binatia bacterium]